MKTTNWNEHSFAVFILTNSRPDSVITDKTLRRCGYTGPVWYVIDNEDKTAQGYFKKFGDKVVVFDKAAIEAEIDTGDNFKKRNTILHARNASFQIAKKLGINYFMQLDDDYTRFEYRIDGSFDYISADCAIKNLDSVFLELLSFYRETSFCSIALSQNGDFIGGSGGGFAKNPTIKRKCMNSFLCSVKRPFQFSGTMNEDVNTYTSLGSRGFLFGTIPLVSLAQKPTQSQSGGITELYLDFGTYVKAFYTVMFQPSSVKVSVIPTANARIHHHVDWRKTVPCIVSEDQKKKAF